MDMMTRLRCSPTKLRPSPQRGLARLCADGRWRTTALPGGGTQGAGCDAQSAPRLRPHFPFQVLVGTSAGALNVAYLASCTQSGWEAFNQLASFWSRIIRKMFIVCE